VVSRSVVSVRRSRGQDDVGRPVVLGDARQPTSRNATARSTADPGDTIDWTRSDTSARSHCGLRNTDGQFETINAYCTLTFDIPGVLGRPRRPPVASNPR
jgi:hypothetical protein